MQARASPAWRRAAPLRLPAAGLANALLLRAAADANAQGLDEDADIFWLSRRFQSRYLEGWFQYSSPGWSEVFMAFSQSLMYLVHHEGMVWVAECCVKSKSVYV